MRQDVYLDLPMTQVREQFDEIVSVGYSVSLFTDWQNGRINQVWLKRRIERDARPSATNDFYGARPATTNVHPIMELSAETARSRWAWRDRGTSGCLTSEWALLRAAGRNSSRSISCRAGMPSTQSLPSSGCGITSARI